MRKLRSYDWETKHKIFRRYSGNLRLSVRQIHICEITKTNSHCKTFYQIFESCYYTLIGSRYPNFIFTAFSFHNKSILVHYFMIKVLTNF